MQGTAAGRRDREGKEKNRAAARATPGSKGSRVSILLLLNYPSVSQLIFIANGNNRNNTMGL